ncbi:MAG TPA: serine/threonine-protein kinase, partial [Ktedonobacteraceae bacterium]|nr:serine/threonine-protein kinase [Ktedonobacteraceae bacterium]
HSQAAVKLLELQLTGPDDFREFLNEARTIRLRHPYIISLLDFGLSRDDTPYLVMEYAVGGTLLQRHPRGTKLPLDRIDSYVSQLASALQYAHDHRVIHRDIKPENVLLRADGTLLLSDFGIAKVLGQSSIVNLQTQIGTPAYMSPEQSRGKPCPASDQYALAVMVYEWLVGQLPFQGNSFRVVLQHRQAVPPSLQTLNPEISIQAEKVVLQALAKKPEERFNTVQQFAQALHAALQESSSTVQTIQPNSISPLLPPELRSGFPRPPKLSTLSPSERRTLRPFQLTRLDETQAVAGRQQGEIPLQTSSPEDTSRMAQSLQTLSPQRVPAQGPRSRNKRLLGRTILIASLFLVLLTGLVWGGRQTLLTQQRLSNSQHATATVQAATFATATAALSAYNMAAATHGVQFGFDAQHTHNNPYERIITSSNVKHLVRSWTARAGGSPVVANGMVYASSDDYKLYAFKANGCGQATCAPLWTAQFNNSLGVPLIAAGFLAVADGIVYISSGDGLYAFRADGCEQVTCTPLWKAQTGGGVSSPTVANGVVYSGSDDGKLYAFKANGCGQATCAPLWT